MTDPDSTLHRLRDATRDLAPPRGLADRVRGRVDAEGSRAPRSGSVIALSAFRLGRWSLGLAAAAAIVAMVSAEAAERTLEDNAAAVLDLGITP